MDDDGQQKGASLIGGGEKTKTIHRVDRRTETVCDDEDDADFQSVAAEVVKKNHSLNVSISHNLNKCFLLFYSSATSFNDGFKV